MPTKQTRSEGEAALAEHSSGCGGFIRLPTILLLIPISKSSLWEMVKRGDFPAPVKLSTRITAWRCDEVRAFISNLCAKEG